MIDDNLKDYLSFIESNYRYPSFMKSFMAEIQKMEDDLCIKELDKSVAVAYGVTCDSCQGFYEYQIKSDNFKCWKCKNNW